MVSSIHINHRRAVIHVLFSQQFQVDVAVNSASTIAEQTVISVSTRSGIADRTARSRDELRNGPMTSREREKTIERDGKEGRDDPVQSRNKASSKGKTCGERWDRL